MTHGLQPGGDPAGVGTPHARCVKAGQALTEAALIDFMKERVASYKYPRTVEFRDTLPKSATGKILKKELRPAPATP